MEEFGRCFGGRSAEWSKEVSAVMQRSSRSAGVRPARNMQYHRSLTISLVIVLVIIRSPASGFIIRRIETSEPKRDLDTADSSILEVRHDLQTSKNVTDEDSNLTTLTLSDPFTTVTTITDPVLTKATDANIYLPGDTINIPISPQNKFDLNNTDATTSQTPGYTVTSIESTSILDDALSPITIGYSTQHTDDNEVTTTETTNVEQFTTNKESSQLSTSPISDNNSKTTSKYTEEKYTNNGIPDMKYKHLNDNLSEALTTITPKMIVSDVTVSSNDIVSKPTNVIATTEAISPSNLDVTISSKSTVEAVSQSSLKKLPSDTTINSNAIYKEANKVTLPDLSTDTTESFLITNPSVSTELSVTDTSYTETVANEQNNYTLPPWKKYKTIERKRPNAVSVEEVTSTDSEMTRAETSRMSLEKVLNNTPIPSLLELKNELLNTPEYTTIPLDSPNMIQVTNATQSETTVLKQMVETQTEKLGIVSSKRAGYLDNTETTKPQPETTTVGLSHRETVNDKEKTAYETDGGESEVSEMLEVKNSTGLESQSQLADDAIKEELLMEKILHEHDYVKEKARLLNLETGLNNETSMDVTLNIPETITDDVLSVKPISEKKKTTILYAVSPNYKPLKKLDVQPSKQFVRDPDDNSWRNESISSLGIVFKPKNASKSFTEVLKNKTTELGNMTEKGDKSDVPDLRIRLGKIAQVRKSKKKKINMFGDTVYSDYEEGSSENSSSSREDTTSPMIPSQHSILASTLPTTSPPASPTTSSELLVNDIQKDNFEFFKEEFSTSKTTVKSKNKLHNLGEYYDSADDYDADYVTKIDLKKFSVPSKNKDTFATRPPDIYATRPLDFLNTKPMPITYLPDRQPTIQYFPPTKKVKATTSAPKVTQKVNIDEYDDDFKNKVNQFTFNEPTKTIYEVSFGTAIPAHDNKIEYPAKQTTTHYTPTYKDNDLNKNLYLTNQPRVVELQGGFVPSDGNFNKESYVIKHYKDFIDDAAKHSEEDKTSEYLPFTAAPVRAVTISDIAKLPTQESKRDEDYNYNTQFRKDVVNRFVDNFNHNSERFKVDFPILYNNSVVHRGFDDNSKVLASSRTFMKRLYETENPKTNFLANVKPCDANCESMAVVDLSPAYELHYYVPEQEEKEQIEPRAVPLPYRYRL